MPAQFQPPPGTRDFYPEQMAVRRYIEDTWRRVSLRHGFQEVDGPTFEFLDLYKVKSGDEIVSQLFHFESREDKRGQSDEFALRPEFTPTLARMIAAKANSLPRPIKWFSIPRCYRAERQQKGRLHEFFQWNADMLGGETPEQRRQFDLETAALCLDGLREFGFTAAEVKLRWNDRQLVEQLFSLAGVPAERFGFAFYLLDRIGKFSPEERRRQYQKNGVGAREELFFEQLAGGGDPRSPEFWKDGGVDFQSYVQTVERTQQEVEGKLALMGLGGFAQYDASIVRGLAYYTGFVWEIADAGGENRAIAGGGRYDKLIEMFGGPALPATGFGMGDVVLGILLEERGKLSAEMRHGAGLQVFVASALENAEAAMGILGELRSEKLSAAASYKATKNVGKLLQEAAGSGAKLAVILAPAEWVRGVVKLKNLATREEKEIPREELLAAVREALVK